MKTIKESVSMTNRGAKGQGKDEMEHREPKAVKAKETEKHEGFYKGPHNQTLKAGREEHADGKKHEDHHPAVKMCKGD
jgi:hypothetical protein